MLNGRALLKLTRACWCAIILFFFGEVVLGLINKENVRGYDKHTQLFKFNTLSFEDSKLIRPRNKIENRSENQKWQLGIAIIDSKNWVIIVFDDDPTTHDHRARSSL